MTFLQFVNDCYRILVKNGPSSFITRAVHYLKYSRKLSSLYNIYLEKNRITESDIDSMKNLINTFEYTPKISIITPVYNVNRIWLEKAINSVINQIYENWEICLVDDASTKKHIKSILEEYKHKDPRINVKYLKDNKGISGASNEALSLATGEFIGFLDHDDELSVNALFEVVKLLQENRDADMIYSDEDKKDTKDNQCDPYFKPDWSPDLFLSSMYTCHFGVYRKKIIDQIGGFRKGFEGSQDYDLVLRFTERTDKIYHIPKILYHWRKIPKSTADRYDAKSYADINARKALEDALLRRKINGKVLSGMFPGSFRIKRDIIDNPKVSIIILAKEYTEKLVKCIESIKKKTTYKNYEIIIVNNRDSQPFEYSQTIYNENNIRILNYEKSFNSSVIRNFAAKNSDSEYLLFLNNNLEVNSEEWLTTMLEHAQRKEIGVVGCKLLYPDDTIAHAGIFLGKRGSQFVIGYSHKHFPNVVQGYFGRPHIIYNLSAVSTACTMIRREVFEEVGGFDENLAEGIYNLDFCLKIRTKNYLIVYTPYAELYYHKSLSNERQEIKQQLLFAEVIYMRENFLPLSRWGNYISNDPYYNPNLWNFL